LHVFSRTGIRMNDAPFLWMLIAALAISACIVVVGW